MFYESRKFKACVLVFNDVRIFEKNVILVFHNLCKMSLAASLYPNNNKLIKKGQRKEMTIIQGRPKAMQLTQLRDQRVNGLGTALGNFYNGATRDDTAPLVVLVFKISCLHF